MATRCNIAVKDGDQWYQNYMHFDGYPEHVLPALANHNSQSEALRLVMGGDMRSIDDDGRPEYYNEETSAGLTVVDLPEKYNDFLYWFEEGQWKYTG